MSARGKYASSRSIREYAARQQADEEEFATTMAAYEKQDILAAQAKVSQANVWAEQLGIHRRYEHQVSSLHDLADLSGGAGAGAELPRITFRCVLTSAAAHHPSRTDT